MVDLSLSGKRLTLRPRFQTGLSMDLPPYKVERHPSSSTNRSGDQPQDRNPPLGFVGIESGSNGTNGRSFDISEEAQWQDNNNQQAVSFTNDQMPAAASRELSIDNSTEMAPQTTTIHREPISSTSTENMQITLLSEKPHSNVHHESSSSPIDNEPTEIGQYANEHNSYFRNITDSSLLDQLHNLNLQQQISTDFLLSRTWSVRPESLDWLRQSINKNPEDQFDDSSDNEGLCFRYVRENPPTKMLHLKQEALKLEELRLLRQRKLQPKDKLLKRDTRLVQGRKPNTTKHDKRTRDKHLEQPYARARSVEFD